MRTFTNNYGLPQAIVDAVTNDPYSKGASDFSVTELIKPARQRALEKAHASEIVEDVADRLWSLYGQVAHTILERANRTALIEKRFFMVVSGLTVSGQIDSLAVEQGALIDYKFTSTWSYVGNKPPKPEHIQQLNMQRVLIEHNMPEVKIQKLQIGALLRDWQLSKRKLGKGYPPPIVVQDIPIWTTEETIRFMQDRIYQHQQAALELPECSSSEHWGHRRCEDYCSVKGFCTQYQTKQEKDNAF